jgi:hypothetical protein
LDHIIFIYKRKKVSILYGCLLSSGLEELMDTPLQKSRLLKGKRNCSTHLQNKLAQQCPAVQLQLVVTMSVLTQTTMMQLLL